MKKRIRAVCILSFLRDPEKPRVLATYIEGRSDGEFESRIHRIGYNGLHWLDEKSVRVLVEHEYDEGE